MAPSVSLASLFYKYWTERMEGCCNHCRELHEFTQRKLSRKSFTRKFQPYRIKVHPGDIKTDEEKFEYYPSSLANIELPIKESKKLWTHLPQENMKREENTRHQTNQTITLVYNGTKKDEINHPSTINLDGETLSTNIQFISKHPSADESDEEDDDLYADLLDAMKLQSNANDNL